MKFTTTALLLALFAIEASAKTRNLKSSKASKGSKGSKSSKSAKSDTVCTKISKPPSATNPCEGTGAATSDALGIENSACIVDGVVAALGQAGADVTVGYKGELDMEDTPPITDSYYEVGICPVNVHWHLGAEHRSEGEYDEDGTGPDDDDHRALAGEVRLGLRCHLYDEDDKKFTKEYKWEHCINMHVGETYEVHWPHSLAGACGTLNQYQTPFYDGVFCNAEKLDTTKLNEQIGVQSQVFVVVNDEDYYYPDLMSGMLVDEELDLGVEITKYTGSTTGTSRDNEICSNYAPITWQVDRTCQMISASSFDKLCADMKAVRDDMADDLYPHGSRELVADELAANNQVNRKLGKFVYH